jgi:hypothetical protein
MPADLFVKPIKLRNSSLPDYFFLQLKSYAFQRDQVVAKKNPALGGNLFIWLELHRPMEL